MDKKLKWNSWYSSLLKFSYTGDGKSNMALIDVDMVSGFEPVIEELEMQQEMLAHLTPYTQFEFIDGVLSFYFNDVSSLSRRPYNILLCKTTVS